MKKQNGGGLRLRFTAAAGGGVGWGAAAGRAAVPVKSGFIKKSDSGHNYFLYASR